MDERTLDLRWDVDANLQLPDDVGSFGLDLAACATGTACTTRTEVTAVATVTAGTTWVGCCGVGVAAVVVPGVGASAVVVTGVGHPNVVIADRAGSAYPASPSGSTSPYQLTGSAALPTGASTGAAVASVAAVAAVAEQQAS